MQFVSTGHLGLASEVIMGLAFSKRRKYGRVALGRHAFV